jgi:hypothetical protein
MPSTQQPVVQKVQTTTSSSSIQKVQPTVSTKSNPAPTKPIQSSSTEQPKKARKNHNLLSSLFGRKKDSATAKQKATVAPTKDAQKNEVKELPKQTPLIEDRIEEKPVDKLESKASNVQEHKQIVAPQILSSTLPSKVEAEKVEEKSGDLLPDPPTHLTILSSAEEVKETKVETPQLLPEHPANEDPQQRLQSVSPPEDPQHEERCVSEASSVESRDMDKPLTNDEQKMLAATTEIMRQLNALDVDTVRVINAPKARMDSDDDLEEG